MSRRTELSQKVARSTLIPRPQISSARGQKRPTMLEIAIAVAAHYKIEYCLLSSKSRSPSITAPRQVAMWIIHRVYNYGCEPTGDFFGGFHHTTVIHASNMVDEKRMYDTKFDDEVSQLVCAISTGNYRLTKARIPEIVKAQGDSFQAVELPIGSFDMEVYADREHVLLQSVRSYIRAHEIAEAKKRPGDRIAAKGQVRQAYESLSGAYGDYLQGAKA